MSRRPLLGRLDPWAVRIRLAGKRLALALAALVPGGARLFYAFGSARFAAEQRVVARGIRQHLAADEPSSLRYRLRRHIHRLEKGLAMRERRAVFGLDHIAQTLADLRRLRACSSDAEWCATAEHGWYMDVLATYFASCASDDSRYVTARAAYDELARRPGPVAAHAQRPYPARLRPVAGIDFAAFATLCHQRRSVRWFTPAPVARALLEQAVAAADQSPSACNRQAVSIRLFENPADARRIAALAPGAAGLYQNFPALAVLVGDQRAYAHERDRHAIYVDGGLKAMSFMLALETLGLSTCALNWPDDGALDRRAAATLALAATERIVLMIAIGHADPDGLVPYSCKAGR